MKHFKWLVSLLLFVPLYSLVPKTVVLKNGIPLGKMMEEKDVFVGLASDICIYNESLFVCDSRRGRVLNVDIHTGKRIRTISSLGQGPGELQFPTTLVIRSGKLFVYDRGFGGIKIFSLCGEFIGSFRTHSVLSMGKSFDVNAENELFFPEYQSKSSLLVSVYSMEGTRLRGMVPAGRFDLKDSRKYLQQSAYTLRLDGNGNIYLLFFLERKIRKCNPKGELIWEKDIENPILKKKPRDDGVRVNARGGLNTRSYVHDLEIDDLNRLFIIHAGGGNVMNENGDILFFLWNENPDFQGIGHSLHWISVFKGLLVNQTLFNTSDLRLYKIKEGNCR